MLRLAARSGSEERANGGPAGSVDPEEAEGFRIARDHGVDPLRVSAYRSLGRSRGLPLDHVLRAAFRGELAMVVALPEARTP